MLHDQRAVNSTSIVSLHPNSQYLFAFTYQGEQYTADLSTAPSLSNNENPKPFHVCVAEKSGYANAVLIQDTPTGKHPFAYYSTKLDSIEVGLPLC